MVSTLRTAVFHKPQRSLNLFSDFNTLQFASVMGLVVFVLLLAFMMDATPHHYGVGVDLPKVLHPISLSGWDREDAIKIVIMRDGKVYFGSDQIRTTTEISARLKDRFKDHSVERKVYISADMRVPWKAVNLVLEQVREAEILRVAFLVNQRRS
ncbi:MAG: ExbD/TolR family protein [Candidatus Sulfotelmatobacter sp.]